MCESFVSLRTLHLGAKEQRKNNFIFWFSFFHLTMTCFQEFFELSQLISHHLRFVWIELDSFFVVNDVAINGMVCVREKKAKKLSLFVCFFHYHKSESFILWKRFFNTNSRNRLVGWKYYSKIRKFKFYACFWRVWFRWSNSFHSVTEF